jgi:NADPH:quinone reductase-like Zn-dependent oxidoreductase
VTAPGAYRAEDLAFLTGLAESGHYRPVIDRIYPLTDIAAAHRHVAGGHKKGNVVVSIAGSDPTESVETRVEQGGQR